MSDEKKPLRFVVEIRDVGRPHYMVSADALNAMRHWNLPALSIGGAPNDNEEKRLRAEREEIATYARTLEAALKLVEAKLRALVASDRASGFNGHTEALEEIADSIGERFE